MLSLSAVIKNDDAGFGLQTNKEIMDQEWTIYATSLFQKENP